MSHGAAPLDLWLQAITASRRLRRCAGESRRGFVRRIARWLRQASAQTAWLQRIRGSEALRVAAQADPRLYDRWQCDYLSTAFTPAARQRMIEAHYRFMHARLPRRMHERLFKGYDVPMASIQVGHGESIHVHLRKPSEGNKGELALFLLNNDKEALAQASFSLAGFDGLVIGAVEGAWPHLGERATRDFVRHTGAQPKDVLLALLRSLADGHDVERIRLVASHAQIGQRASREHDALASSQDGTRLEDGCYELPRQWKAATGQDFIAEACQQFEQAFDSYTHGTAAWRTSGTQPQDTRDKEDAAMPALARA